VNDEAGRAPGREFGRHGAATGDFARRLYPAVDGDSRISGGSLPRANMSGVTPEVRASTRDLMSLINESTQFFGRDALKSHFLLAGSNRKARSRQRSLGSLSAANDGAGSVGAKRRIPQRASSDDCGLLARVARWVCPGSLQHRAATGLRANERVVLTVLYAPKCPAARIFSRIPRYCAQSQRAL
jgi:hypothetical protein